MSYYTFPTQNSIPIPQLSSSVRSVSPGEEDGIDSIYYPYRGDEVCNHTQDFQEWHQPYSKPHQRRGDESRYYYHQDTQFPLEVDSQSYATAVYPEDRERPSNTSAPIMVPKRNRAGSDAPHITVSEYGYEAGAKNSYKHIYPPRTQTLHHTFHEQRDHAYPRQIRVSGNNEYRHETPSEYSQCPSPSSLRSSAAFTHDSSSYTTSASPPSSTFSEFSTPLREVSSYGRLLLPYEEREPFTRYSK